MHTQGLYLMGTRKLCVKIHSSREGQFFNRKEVIFFLTKNIYCGTHQKHLAEVLLMSTHNICFHGEIKK